MTTRVIVSLLAGALAGGVVVIGCGSKSGRVLPPATGGGGLLNAPGPIGGGTLSPGPLGGPPGATPFGFPPGAPGGVMIHRDPAGYQFDTHTLNAIPSGEVTALGIAPTASDSLVVHAPVHELQRVHQGVPIVPAETVLPATGTSIAAMGTRVFAASTQRGQAGAGDVYLRTEPAPGVVTWWILLDTTAEAAVVHADAGGAVAAVGEGTNHPARLYRFDDPSGRFVPDVGLALEPSAIVTWGQDVYVGGTDTGGGAQLRRVRNGALEVLAVPGSSSTAGVRQRVTGFTPGYDAAGMPVLVVAVGSFDAVSDAPLSGEVSLFDGQTFTPALSLTNDAPLAVAAADGTVYVGTATGKLQYRDANGAFVDEPNFPSVSRVTSLLTRDAKTLLIGCRTPNGATLVVRTGLSP